MTPRHARRTVAVVGVAVVLGNEAVAATVRTWLPSYRSAWLVPKLVLLTRHEHPNDATTVARVLLAYSWACRFSPRSYCGLIGSHGGHRAVVS